MAAASCEGVRESSRFGESDPGVVEADEDGFVDEVDVKVIELEVAVPGDEATDTAMCEIKLVFSEIWLKVE